MQQKIVINVVHQSFILLSNRTQMTTLEENFKIPEFQNACVFEEHGGPITYKQVPVPKPEPNEILVKISYTGVCHSDLHAWKGDWPNKSKLPLIGGHEGSGVVVAMGSLVKNFKIGDFAGIKWLNKSCLDCEYCEKGFEISCSNGIEISGYTRNGTFQQYATADAMQAAHIPKGTDLAAVAPVLCAGVTAYKALKVADLQAGEWVAISGAGGGLGSYGIQYAKALGLRVLAIDGGDEKGKLCRELGAEAYVDFTKSKDLIKEVQEITSGGPHGAINVSISELAVSQSCQYIRMLGKIVLVGIPSGAELKCPIIDVVFKCFEIKGTSVGNRLDTSETIDFFNRGLIKSPIKIVGLSELPQVFNLMLEGKIAGRYVLDNSK